MSKRIKVTDEEIIEASNVYASATAASASLGIQYGTYRKHAERLGVFKTNQSGKGTNKISGTKIPLSEILEGNHPQYQSNKLRIRLIAEGIKEHKCESCYNTEWLGKPISLELEHVDGNHSNHLYENLKLLCPNCHAQTDTYRGKNVKARVVERYTQGT